MEFMKIWELQELIGKNVSVVNRKTGERWKAERLLEYKITRDTVIAIMHEDFNIEVDLRIFYLSQQK